MLKGMKTQEEASRGKKRRLGLREKGSLTKREERRIDLVGEKDRPETSG